MAESETIGFCEDILMEVLAFLPPASVFRFKSVSRQWRDLLSSPAFLRRYAAVHRGGDRLVAFFQEAGVLVTSRNHCNILPIRNDYIHVPRHVGHFVSSSNGLILCSRSRGTNVTYHVGNPLTGKFVELPPPPGKSCLMLEDQPIDKYGRDTSECTPRNPPLYSAGLIYEKINNDEPPVYTVVRAGFFDFYQRNRILYVDSYSSDSGKWDPAIRTLVATGTVELSEGPPAVANGVVHWYTESGDVAVYDPRDGDGHVQLIKVPNPRKDENTGYAVTRSADDGVLWLAVLRRKNLLFYMLPKETGYKRQVDIQSHEWELMYDDSILSISKLMKKGLIACEKATFECLITESESESEPEVVAVLQQKKQAFLYNPQRKTIQKLHFSGRYNRKHRLCPLFGSSNLSSYSL